MSTVGVFARADHPQGWGFVAPGEEYGRAHGYVVLFVCCADMHELEMVAHRLARQDFVGKPGATYLTGALDPGGRQWFGGRFDWIATVPDVHLDRGPFMCRGDNRMVAVYDAPDVLT